MAKISKIEIDGLSYDLQDLETSEKLENEITRATEIEQDLLDKWDGLINSPESVIPIKTVNGEDLIGTGNIEIIGERGEKGDKGEKGEQGEPGITGVTVSVDNTIGTPSATATITGQVLDIKFKGLKGEQGNSGYTGAVDELEIVNNLTQGGATSALSAEMGKELANTLRTYEEVILELYTSTNFFPGGDGLWKVNYNNYSTYMGFIMPVSGIKMRVVSNATNPSRVCFLTTDVVIANASVDYAIGYSGNGIDIPAGTTQDLDIPSDAAYCYIATHTKVDVKPVNISILGGLNAIESINKNTKELSDKTTSLDWQINGAKDIFSVVWDGGISTSKKFYREDGTIYDVSTNTNASLFAIASLDISAYQGETLIIDVYTIGDARCLLVNESGIIISTWSQTSEKELTIPSDATVLKLTNVFNYYSTPSVYMNRDGLITQVNDIDSSVNEISKYLEKFNSCEEVEETEEEGLFITDSSGYVALKYDKSGFDVAQVSNHFKELLENDNNTTATIKYSDFATDGIDANDIIDSMLEFSSSFTYRRLVLDRNIEVSRAILLPSDTTVIIDNITITQADLTFDNVFRGTNIVWDIENLGSVPSEVAKLKNIKILGNGEAKIVGPSTNATYNHPTLGQQTAVGDFYGIRTHQISMTMVDGVEISGISFSRTRGWCICFDFCTNGVVSNISITTGSVKNGDGIDLRVGCKNFLVSDVTLNTYDDGIALTALHTSNVTYPRDNYLFPNEGASQMITSLVSSHGKEICYIENVVIKNANVATDYGAGVGHGMICLSASGAKVQNVYINNLYEKDSSVSKEALLKLYYGYGSGYSNGDINNIKVNIANTIKYPYVVMSNCICDNIWLNKLMGGTTAKTLLTYTEGFTITNS